MQIEGLGTVIMFGVAAVLWFAYLVPTWFRRREYLATERNATRLQQTLRIMAETAEVPDAVRAEATARGAAHQERLLKERERQRAARERAVLAATRRAEESDAVGRRVVAAERRRAGLRRGRLVASLVLFAALVTVGVQGALTVTAGAVHTPAVVVLAAGGIAGFAAIGTLRSLARRRIPAPVLAAAEPITAPVATAPAVRVSAREWTPVPVPKPRYLGSPAPQPVVPAPDADRLLRQASAVAREALRSAHREAEVLELPTRTAEPAASSPAPSRWASMGVVDDLHAAAPDLDEVLRRRRAAG